METVEWFLLAEHINEIPFNPNGMAIVTVNHKHITIAKHNNAIFACAHKCPHASGIMANGFITPIGEVVCPLHRYKFSLQNGRNTSGEGFYLKTYALKTEIDGKIYIGLEKKGLFGW